MKKSTRKLKMITHNYNPCIWEGQEGGLQIQVLPEQSNKISQSKKQKRTRDVAQW